MTLFFSFILSLALILGGPATPAHALVNQVVAVVEGNLITLDEVDQRIISQLDRLEKAYSGQELKEQKKKLRHLALEAMIDDLVAESEAKAMGIKISDEELNETIKDVMARNRINRVQLQRTLAMDGLTWEAYRKTVRRQLLQSKLVYTALKPKIIIPEKDKRALYKEWADKYKGVKEITLARIVLSEDQADLAKSLVDDLKNGADFTKLAKEFSIAPDGQSGGLLGSFEMGQLSPSLAKAVKNLQTGQTTGVLKTKGGYQIFKVVKIGGETGKTFEQAEEELTEELTQRAIAKKFREWIKKVRQRRFVKIMKITD